MIKEEVVSGRTVYYCDRFECVLDGYLGMTQPEAVSHLEQHVTQTQKAIKNI